MVVLRDVIRLRITLRTLNVSRNDGVALMLVEVVGAHAALNVANGGLTRPFVYFGMRRHVVTRRHLITMVRRYHWNA